MRHFMQLDPDATTLYFKDHQNSIKDKSTMKNALGYKFEKKKKEGAQAAGGYDQEINKQRSAPWGGIAANDKYSEDGKVSW